MKKQFIIQIQAFLRFKKNQYMRNVTLCFLLVIVAVFNAKAQYSTNKTYILTQSPKVAGLKTGTSVDAASYTSVNRNIQYFDRLGRPSQTVVRQFTPNAKDQVSFHQYNTYGQELKEYLPYASTGTTGSYRTGYLSEQSSFYSASGVNYGTTSHPWVETDVEESPIKRILEKGNVGSSYQLGGYTTKFVYGLNESTDNVLKWEVNSSGGLQLATGTYYSSNSLEVTTTKDPNWQIADGNIGTTKTFKDYMGRVILSRSYNSSETYDTYYVYDLQGNLSYVMTPEGVREVLISNPVAVNQTIIDKWAYVHKYDSKNQLISKKLPGAQEIIYVYDKAGRLILSQDGIQRGSNKWTFTKYDRFDRPILTGTVTDTRNQATLTSYLSVEITPTNNKWYEDRGTTVLGYTNRVWPYVSSANDYMVVTYYDDYDFKSTWGSIYDYQANTINTGSPQAMPIGQETGSQVRILGTTTWLKSVNYYDENTRLIQSVEDNHLGFSSRFFASYSFVGDVLKKRLEQKISTTKTVSLQETYEYDHGGRLLKEWHSVDDEPEVLLASYLYNELEEPIETNLHSTDNGATFIQSVDARFDAMGRLTHINNAQRNNDGVYNNDATDKFGMELYYDTSPSGFSFTPQRNGNLVGVTWSNSTMGSIDQRGYKYGYDRSNRLVSAIYKEKDNGSWNIKQGHYDVGITDYDFNGNIEKLNRKQSISGSATTIDNLVYTYNGNQVKAVDDLVNHVKGFKDGAESSTEYTYNVNGSLISDSNKLITSIAYNELNLPSVITFSSGDKITNTYSAAGIKLKQQITISSQVVQTYDYLGHMIIDNGELAEIAHSKGRLKVETFGNDFNYDYQYFLKDHLGNTRVMIAPMERKYVAGMESDRATQEEAQFLYVSQTRFSGNAKTGSKSSMLNAYANKVLGPAKAIKVYNGDQVNMEVWAKHASTSGVNETSPSNVLLAALSSAFGVSSGSTGEALQIYNGFNSVIGSSTLLNQTPGQIPAAYLNYIFFNTNYSHVSSGFVQVNSTSYTKLTNTFTANQDGYLFIYLSNESTLNANVYFDDLSITHTSASATLQADDFYPFGLPMDNNGFLEAGIEANRFLYQGKEWQTDLGLNLFDFNARQYDPALGRWLSMDPKNQFASPYLGMGNNPLIGIDPDGQFWHIVIGAVIGGVANTVTKALQGKITNLSDGLKAFGVGALAGGVGAATGGWAFAAAGGGAGGIGGALAGGWAGVIGTGVSAPILGLGNTIFFGDEYMSTREYAANMLFGGITGGLGNGILAKIRGRNFWNGNLPGSGTKVQMPKLNLEKYELPERQFPKKPVNQIQPRELPDNYNQFLDDPLAANGTSLAGDIAQKYDFRSFTREAFRDNLKRLTGVSPSSDIIAHHVIPHEFLDDALAAGVNVNNPLNGMWLSSQVHRQIHAQGYNQLWKEFFTQKRTAEEIFKFGESILRRFNIY